MKISPMKLLKWLLAAPLLLFSLIAGADNAPAGSNIEDLLPQHCYFSGRFTQERTLKGIPAPLESQGNFLFSCDHGLIWQTESPTRETVIYTRGKQHFHLSGDNRIEPLKGRIHSNMARLLNGLMSADTRYLENYFDFHSNTESGGMNLLPEKKAMRRFMQQLTLQKTDESVEIKLINDSENRTHIRISDTVTLENVGPKECAYHYPEPAGICHALLTTGNK